MSVAEARDRVIGGGPANSARNYEARRAELLRSRLRSKKLADLLRLPEGNTLEFKGVFSALKQVLRTLVAFANAAGGQLLIGVEDGTREVRGVVDPLALEQRLANLVADGIRPLLLPEIEVWAWRDTHVLRVTVHPSPLRPHHVIADGPERGTMVRLGSTNRSADGALIAELTRSVGRAGFDEQPLAQLQQFGG